MASLFSLYIILLSLAILSTSTTFTIEAQGIKSTRLLDLVIRDYTFKSYSKYFRTGIVHDINLPANLSGIKVNTIRFRCGSLARYGAKVQEFHLAIGVNVQPCVHRVLLVTQNLGYNWSNIYYDNYELSGYELVSPVLGLLAYNAGDDMNFINQIEVKIESEKNPIKIDFSNTTIKNDSGMIHLCAAFGDDGKVTLDKQVSQNVCATMGQGHFGLVVESPLMPSRKKLKGWKVAFGTIIGAAIGIFLLTLLVIAMFAKVKKKARMEELERRAYEEEALQVSMVGHVRAHTAAGTRTVPTIEHEDKRKRRNYRSGDALGTLERKHLKGVLIMGSMGMQLIMSIFHSTLPVASVLSFYVYPNLSVIKFLNTINVNGQCYD